jgi:hypothetical protein
MPSLLTLTKNPQGWYDACLPRPGRYMQSRHLVTFYSGPHDGDNSVQQAQTGKLILLRNDKRNLIIKNHYK